MNNSPDIPFKRNSIVFDNVMQYNAKIVYCDEYGGAYIKHIDKGWPTVYRKFERLTQNERFNMFEIGDRIKTKSDLNEEDMVLYGRIIDMYSTQILIKLNCPYHNKIWITRHTNNVYAL